MRRIQSHDVRMLNMNNQEDLQQLPTSKWDRFLKEVFPNEYITSESIQSFKERMAHHRRQLLVTNLHNYKYSRAHHYHFLLDDFQRIPNQLSYALDYHNSMRATFSQEDKLYKGDRLGFIANRVAFTCPRANQHSDLFVHRKRGKTHNSAHDHLFAVQNTKISLDQQLLTCRKILKNFQKLSQNYSLWQFSILKKPQLQFLLDQQLQNPQKKKQLEQRINRLQEIKSNTTPTWEVNDQMFLYSSLQQKLHDGIDLDETLEAIQISLRIQNFVNKHIRLVESLGRKDTDFDAVLKKIFNYYHSKRLAISLSQIQRLKTHIQKINKPLKTTLPVLLFNFGSLELREKVNQIIANFIIHRQIETKDGIITTLSKLFKASFEVDESQDQITSYEAKSIIKSEKEEIKKCLEANNQKNYVCLDESINEKVLDESTAGREEVLPLLVHSNYKVNIWEEQFQTLFYYDALCNAIVLLQPYIHQQNHLMAALCSPYLEQVLHGIIGHTPNKAIGQLVNNLKHLVQHSILSNFAKQDQVQSEFCWEFNQETGVGIIWNYPKKPSQGKDLSHFYSIMLNKKQSQPNQSQNSSSYDDQQEPQDRPLRKIVKQNQDSN